MLHLIIQKLATIMALLGGAMLCLIVVMVCVSVSGRELSDLAYGSDITWLIEAGVGPILGDFELVEAGVAFAIFSFLPLTQLRGAHAQVDVFTSGMGDRVNAGLATFWTVIMALMTVLITWRLFVGMQDKMRYGETTYLIQFPIWWAYAASLLAAVTASIVSVYCAVMRLAGQPLQ